MSLNAKNRVLDPKPGFEFQILNIKTGITKTYTSIRKGVKDMGWDQGYIMNRLKKDVKKPYLLIYDVSYK